MSWRVVKNGAMIEVVNGVRTLADGGQVEQTATAIYASGALIRGEISKSLVERYDDNDAYVRSIVERVEIGVDEDGEQTVNPIGKPESDQSGIVPEDVAAELSEKDAKIAELERQLEEAHKAASEGSGDTPPEGGVELITDESGTNPPLSEYDQLKAQATALGHEFPANVSKAKLNELIASGQAAPAS